MVLFAIFKQKKSTTYSNTLGERIELSYINRSKALSKEQNYHFTFWGGGWGVFFVCFWFFVFLGPHYGLWRFPG